MTREAFNRARLAFLDKLRRDRRLTPATRLIGLEIGAHLNSTSEEAWPSHERLVETLGLGMGTVKRAIRELAAYGYYKIDRRPSRNGRKNFYRVLFDKEGPNLDLAGCSAGEEVRTNLDPTDCSSTVGSKSKRATGQLDTEEGPKTEPRSPLMNSERAPSSAGGDDSGDVTASASTVALFNQLIAILGIDLFAQGNNANQRATRREDVHWVGEQLALFEPIFDGHPYMDGRRCIVSIAHHVKRKLRPDTIIRTVRYLQPALARQYRELSDLREGALSASSAEKYRSWGTEGYVDRDPLGPAAPSSR